MAQSEKMAALGGLVAGVAHELNTPIGVSLTATSSVYEHIQEMTRRLEKNQLKKSDLDQFMLDMDEFCDLSMRNIRRAADLIRNFKQVAVDQTSERRRVFKLDEYVDEVLSTVQPKLKHTEVTFKSHIEKIELNSYPGPLGQIVTNFIDNSLLHGFGDRKDGEIYLEATLTSDQTVFILYQDNGAGIAPDVQERIFEPFFTTAVDKMGSGLGMHIAYNIVTRLLGGTIRVESEPGEFTRFVIVIPKTAPERADENIYSAT